MSHCGESQAETPVIRPIFCKVSIEKGTLSPEDGTSEAPRMAGRRRHGNVRRNSTRPNSPLDLRRKTMDSSRVSYELAGRVATIVLDDGNRNVISPRMIRELNDALSLAEKEKAVVVLTGREDVFSAGFDLAILKRGVFDAFGMICGGFELAARLLSFPTPVVIACNGHAIAMGAFLLLSGDLRIGTPGRFRIVTNEVAIGLTMPFAGVEICRQRLAPAHFVRAAVLAEDYTPETAVEAGFLDRLVAAEDLLPEAVATATRLAELDLKAHYRTKLRARRQLLKKLKRAMLRDRVDFVLQGARRVLGR